MGKEKKISREDIAKMSREERMKYEIAQELGLLDQVLEEAAALVHQKSGPSTPTDFGTHSKSRLK